jgi:hypothetical protein
VDKIHRTLSIRTSVIKLQPRMSNAENLRVSAHSTISFASLPAELLHRIFEYLVKTDGPSDELLAAVFVCKTWMVRVCSLQ